MRSLADPHTLDTSSSRSSIITFHLPSLLSSPSIRMGLCVKDRWTASEDAQLMELVNKYGAKSWIRIASFMKDRSNKSCRSRYLQHLAPSINSDPITLEEGNLIIKLVEEIGKQWAEIARRLPRRTDSTVKNWWYTAKKRDCRIEQRLELIDSRRKVMKEHQDEGTKGRSEDQPRSIRPAPWINTVPVGAARPQMQHVSLNLQPQHRAGHLRIEYQQQYQYPQQNYLQNYQQEVDFLQEHALSVTQVNGGSTRFTSALTSLQDCSPPPSPWAPLQFTAPEAHYPSAATSERQYIPLPHSQITSYAPSNRPNLEFDPKNLATSPNKQSSNSCVPVASLWSFPSTRSIHPQEIARRMETYREGIAKLSQSHYEQCGRFQILDPPLRSKQKEQGSDGVLTRG